MARSPSYNRPSQRQPVDPDYERLGSHPDNHYAAVRTKLDRINETLKTIRFCLIVINGVICFGAGIIFAAM